MISPGSCKVIKQLYKSTIESPVWIQSFYSQCVMRCDYKFSISQGTDCNRAGQEGVEPGEDVSKLQVSIYICNGMSLIFRCTS